MDDKKKYVIPVAEIVKLDNSDIITDSMNAEEEFDWESGGIREGM